MPSGLTSVFAALRRIAPGIPNDAVRARENAVVNFSLFSRDEEVNHAYQSVLRAAREYCATEPLYTYEALRRLHEASLTFVRTFNEAANNNSQSTQGNLPVALDQAKRQLPVQPGRHAAVLAPLLREVQTAVTACNSAPATSEITDNFPALHAALTAYMEALGSQPLHSPRKIVEALPGWRLKARTHEDIHEQALRSLQPLLFANARRPAKPSYLRPPREDNDVLPSYFILRNSRELSLDLHTRAERAFRKLRKPIGTTISDPSAFALLEEVKLLLGSVSITPEERGEILLKLAINIPSNLQVGGTEPKKMARLFLRFLAPVQLSRKHRQTQAALNAGAERFNAEALVSSATSEPIVANLILQIQRFGIAGKIVCQTIEGALKARREVDPVRHASLLRQAAIAINRLQRPRNRENLDWRLFQKLVSIMVNEIIWLDEHVAKMGLASIPVDVIHELLDFENNQHYDLRGLAIPGIPEWQGDLNTLPAYTRLLQNLASLPIPEPFEFSSSDQAPTSVQTDADGAPTHPAPAS